MAADNWQSGRRRSNQLYMLGGRVWKGLVVMEYYQVMVRRFNVRLTRRIQERSRLRLQPFDATNKDFKCEKSSCLMESDTVVEQRFTIFGKGGGKSGK